jgi:hypothetical protein
MLIFTALTAVVVAAYLIYVMMFSQHSAHRGSRGHLSGSARLASVSPDRPGAGRGVRPAQSVRL